MDDMLDRARMCRLRMPDAKSKSVDGGQNQSQTHRPAGSISTFTHPLEASSLNSLFTFPPWLFPSNDVFGGYLFFLFIPKIPIFRAARVP